MLTKNSNPINILGARKVNFLCLSSIILGVLALTTLSAQAQQNPVYARSNNAAAQTEIRLQQMETQIRELTGKVEEQVYEINSLKQKINRLQNAPQNLTANQNNAPQQIRPSGGQMGASQIDIPSRNNPLGLDLSAQQPKGMQSATVIPANNDATANYEKAYADLKSKDYGSAEKGFDQFLSVHSDHVLAANAKYWLGETHYVRGDYKKAARIFAEGFQKYPDSAKAPDILLKLALSLRGLDKNRDACVALSQIPVKFPTGHDDVVKRAEKERASLSCDA